MTKRNEHGVASSINKYRTIGNERFICFSAGEATRRTAETYRMNQVRARFLDGELFVHHADEAAARVLARMLSINP